MNDAINIRSPFKFLDPYEKEDHHLFFGREKELEQLYEQTQLSKLSIVYGASGTGKTSLINCGLTNKFRDTDWNPLFIRRGRNIIESTMEQIRLQLDKKDIHLPEKTNLSDAIEKLFWARYIPIYLIFDQFEELFIEGNPSSEQIIFFQELNNLLQSESSSRVILVLREEYLAWLSDFETIIPDLFDNRLRIEKMNELRLRKVIEGTLTAKEFMIELINPEETTNQIINNIRGERREVDLTDLQVYLDHLYRKATIGNDGCKIFDPKLVSNTGEMTNVLSIFLEESIQNIEKDLKDKFQFQNSRGVPLEILFTMVTNDMTKRAMERKEISTKLKQADQLTRIKPEVLDYCLDQFIRLRLLNQMD